MSVLKLCFVPEKKFHGISLKASLDSDDDQPFYCFRNPGHVTFHAQCCFSHCNAIQTDMKIFILVGWLSLELFLL